MKYSLIKKLIEKDIKNIFSALSSNNYNLSEIDGNILNAIEHAKILNSTFESNIEYNYIINENLVNLWAEAEKDSFIISLINTYGRGKLLACVLLYNRGKINTLSLLNNSKILNVGYKFLVDINVIDNINEITYLDINDGSLLSNNSIYINSNGNVIYNIAEEISSFSFCIIGAIPTEVIYTTGNSGVIGDAIID